MIDRTDFTPSDAQRRLVGVFQAHDYDISVVEACTEAGVGRQTYYDWHQAPGFSPWWIGQAEAFFAKALPRVWGRILRRAAGEDVQADVAAARLLVERYDQGFAPRSRQETRHSGGMALEALSDLSEDEKRTRIETLASILQDVAEGKAAAVEAVG